MATTTSPKRLFMLTALASFIGLIAGGAAYVLIHLIALLTNLALFHRYSWTLPSLAHLHASINLPLVAVAGGLLIGVMAKWAPVIKGHGIPEAMEAVLIRQSRVSPRTALAKPLSAAIAIGTGGPFGAEGPIIVTGGAIGSLLGQIVDVSASERKILLACGAAAGMAATFGAPLASVVLAIELLLFEFSTRAFIPLVVASSLAAGVHVTAFGSGPLFTVPSHNFAGLDKLPFYVGLGVICGFLAILITKGLFLVEAGFRKLPINEFWHPAIGALGFALVGLIVPRALGVGYDQISAVLAGKLALGLLAIVAVAKLIAWWIALGSGTSGGTLAPMLLISGSAGAAIGNLATHVFPNSHLSPGAFALVAMAATFGAATRATFTAIVFLFELTRDYHAILPLMLASVVADLIAAPFLHDSIMTEKLARRGLSVHHEYEVDVMRSKRVRDVMTKDVQTLPSDATLRDADRLFASKTHTAFPLTDPSGNCAGIVTQQDLLADDASEETPLSDLIRHKAPTVAPDDLLVVAVEQFVEEDIDHLPVVDASGKLVGIVTKSDVLRARAERFAHERAEPGWRPLNARKQRAS
ncbi:MAG: chloride channel protein [Actinomycetota bacterium]